MELAAAALYRYRLARLIKLERVRTHVAADLHDDIGANLTKIALLSEVAQPTLQRFALECDSMRISSAPPLRPALQGHAATG